MSTGAWWKEHWEALGATTLFAINQLCDLGELTLPLCALIPSPVRQVHVHGLAPPKGCSSEY